MQSARDPLPAGVVSAFQELSEVVTAGYKLDSPGKAHFPWNVLESFLLEENAEEAWALGAGRWEVGASSPPGEMGL